MRIPEYPLLNDIYNDELLLVDGGRGTHAIHASTLLIGGKTALDTIADTEETNIASRPYLKGEQFYLNGELLKAITDIAEGDTFEIPVNCTYSGTLTGQIKELEARPIYVNKGTCLFANLPSTSQAEVGDMWNISDAFVTTSDFREGPGVRHNAGSNVYFTSDNLWDVYEGESFPDRAPLIANVEVTPSTHEYEVDDRFIYNDVLYKAIDDISIGDELTELNCEPTGDTIVDMIKDLEARPMYVNKGTCRFSELPSTQVAAIGDMWNISDKFITTADFREGAGHKHNAGANVYLTSDRLWDVYEGESVSDVVEILAPVETSPSAHAYAEGQQFVYNEKLYTATTDIAVGDLIEPKHVLGEVVGSFALASASRTNLIKFNVDGAEYQPSSVTVAISIGSVITLYHDSSRTWKYKTVNEEVHDLSVGEACYFTVPEGSFDAGVLTIESTDSIDTISFNLSTGWLENITLVASGEPPVAVPYNCELSDTITEQLDNIEIGTEIDYLDYMQLPAAERNSGDYFVRNIPINSSILPIGGIPMPDASGGSIIKITPVSSALYGQTVTVTGSSKTVIATIKSTGTTDISGFTDIGDVTISASGGGVDYTETINIRYFGVYDVELGTPKGSTITPINTIQTWLATGEIIGKSYSTLNEVLADTETLRSLINNHNAMDYLVRSTDWVSGICGSVVAMTYIGENNYASDTLLDDSTWQTGICNSTHFEKVLNTKVPTMTSNTTPSGEASSSSYMVREGINYYAYKAFDGITGALYDGWFANNNPSTNPQWLGYAFTKGIKIYKVSITPNCEYSNGTIKNFQYETSDDGSNWNIEFSDVCENVSNFTTVQSFVKINPSQKQYHRIYITSSYGSGYASVQALQFYGRTPVAEPTDIEARVESLENQVGNTDISSIGSTVTGALSNIDAHNHYSTSETWTGKYWIDGKKIYFKTFTGTLPSNTGDYAFNHNIDSISEVIDRKGYVMDSAYYWVPFGFYQPKSSGNGAYYVNTYMTTTEIRLRCESSYASQIFKITIFYTKTTD